MPKYQRAVRFACIVTISASTSAISFACLSTLPACFSPGTIYSLVEDLHHSQQMRSNSAMYALANSRYKFWLAAAPFGYTPHGNPIPTKSIFYRLGAEQIEPTLTATALFTLCLTYLFYNLSHGMRRDVAVQ